MTGASGMVGRHVIGALAADGLQALPVTRGVDATQTRSWDLTQWKSDAELDSLFESVDAIVHAGAAVPRPTRPTGDGGLFDANVRAPANLGDWARRRGLPVVFISGAIVYANPTDDAIPEDAPLGWSGFGGFYGLSKLLAEDVLRREEQAGLKLAVLRPTSIYGNGLGAEKMVTSMAATANRGDAIELTEPVDDATNFVHAADVASAVVNVLRREAWSTFNIASDQNTTVRALAEACVDVAGKGRIDIRNGGPAARAAVNRFRLNCDRARRELGWSPRISLAAGIRAILDENAIVNN